MSAPEEPCPERPDPLSDWPLGRLLSTAARMIEHDWNAVLADHDLTHAGLVALAALRDGPLTQVELAEASRVEQQTMSRTVAKLERGGHVVRTRDDDDRRRRTVSLTDHGRDTLGRVGSTDLADAVVAEHLDDPARFRAELARVVRHHIDGAVSHGR